MIVQQHDSRINSSEVEAFLSGAVQRIQKTTIALGVAGSIAATAFFGWRSGMGCAIGSLLGYVNLMWLHYGSTMMIERLLAPAGQGPSRFRLLFSFAGRYLLVIAITYVILKGFSGMILGFIVALLFPILAAMSEGVYEAWTGRKFGNWVS